MEFARDSDNTFSLDGCYNFMNYEEFCNNLASYLDDNALTIVCEMGIFATFEEVGQPEAYEQEEVVQIFNVGEFARKERECEHTS